MKTKIYNYNCDGGSDGNCTGEHSQVRVLPFSNGNLLLCYAHYLREIKYRKARNKELENFAKFDLPEWKDLRIYDLSEE